MTDEVQQLLEKLSIVRNMARELMISAVESEGDKWRVPFYQKLIDGVDRRAEVLGKGGLVFPNAGNSASIGLYKGVSEWCEDDQLMAAVADVESYYLELQAG